MKKIEKILNGKYGLTLLYIVFLIILFLITSSCADAKSTVYVNRKKHLKKSEMMRRPVGEYCLWIKRVNCTNFFLWSKERVLYTNKENYDNLKIGDSLKTKY